MNYEIHITVPVLDPFKQQSRIEKLESVAERVGAKVIVIAADPLLDVMTSCRIKTTDQNEAFATMRRQVRALEAQGFKAIRCKVETDLRHPAARTPLPNQYFESHLQLIMDEDDLARIQVLKTELDFHVSYNAFKPVSNGLHIRMATVREYLTTPADFKARVENLRNILAEKNFVFAKGLEIEFVLYDSNVAHDHSWITSR